QTVCNGVATTASVFSGTVSGSAYTWSNSNPGIGLPSSGTGNIASFIAANAGISPITATVMVTPSANGCIGISQRFTITVNPTPSVSVPSGQTICNGNSAVAVAFAGPVSGTVYNWTNSNAAIGLAMAGTGNISSFRGTNSSLIPVSGVIIVTPAASGCM